MPGHEPAASSEVEVKLGGVTKVLLKLRRIEGKVAITVTGAPKAAVRVGEPRSFGLRYVVALYNLADRRYALPVSGTFRSRTMPQHGRTFLVEVMGTFPP